MKFSIEDHLIELLRSEKLVYIKMGGNFVPLFIEKVKLKNPMTIKFDNVDNKEDAAQYCNQDIFLPAEKVTIEKDVSDDLAFGWAKAYLIIDPEEKVIGEIIEVREFPQQEMAVVMYEEREILLPLHPDLVIGIDEEEKVMMLDIAEGLLDL